MIKPQKGSIFPRFPVFNGAPDLLCRHIKALFLREKSKINFPAPHFHIYSKLLYNITAKRKNTMKRLPFFIFALIFFMFLFSYCGKPSRPQSYSFRTVSVSGQDQNAVKDFLRAEMGRSKVQLNDDYNVDMAEQWNDESPVITVWLSAFGGGNINIIEKASGRKLENVEKYDPLSKTKVNGTYYEIDAFVSVFLFQKDSRYFAKVQESFISRAALEKLSGIFFNSAKHAAGGISAYDDWRPGIV